MAKTYFHKLRRVLEDEEMSSTHRLTKQPWESESLARSESFFPNL